jgi:hypothetical protein
MFYFYDVFSQEELFVFLSPNIFSTFIPVIPHVEYHLYFPQ